MIDNSLLLIISVFTLIVCAFYFGVYLRWRFPAMLGPDEISEIKFVSVPVIGILILVLAMMLVVTRGRFEARQLQIERMAADIIATDRLLEFYGPLADYPRKEFREYVNFLTSNPLALFALYDRKREEPFARHILDLPVGAYGSQSAAKKTLIDKLGDISEARFRLATQNERNIRPATMFVVVLWACALFFVMGACATINPVVLLFGFLSAATVSSVFYLSNEFDRSNEGFIQISTAPLKVMREALKLK